MKAVILGDTHFGCRGDLKEFHDYFSKFYNQVLFPYMEQNNITHIFQMGDLFDRRKYISFQTLYLCRKYFFDKIKDKNFYMFTLLGNHDIYFRNTLEVNSPTLLLGEYSYHITVVDRPMRIQGVDLIPWICKDNETEILEYIKNSKARLCLGHFELNGYEMDRGSICTEGRDAGFLSNYELVLSGHFHHRSMINNVLYVGSPAEMTWADFEDDRGFYVIDTETLEIEFIKNPFKMFAKIYYNEDEIPTIIPENIKGTYIKIVVVKRTDPVVFDAFVASVMNSNPIECTVVEDFTETLSGEAEQEFEIDQAEDTISILSKYVDGVKMSIDPVRVKSIMRDTYHEAMAAEDSE